MKTKWLERNSQNIDRAKIINAMDKWGITEPFAKIMLARGIEDIDAFISPTKAQLHDPFLFLGMDVAIERIIKAIREGEKITIYGDYDVDGITATTIILTYFRELGYTNISYYIPDRTEGYGVNMPALQRIRDDGTKLLITVDCGITSQKEVDFANEIGLDVIVTDHHEQEGEVPNAIAVINPKRHDSGYPFTGICGACVAYKLMLALHTKLENKPNFSEDLEEFYDFVAFATVADIVPLTDENRFLVKRGLSYFSPTYENRRPVFVKLTEAAFGNTLKKVNASDIGFKLAPRINAVGRIARADMAVEYFNFAEESQYGEILNRFNNLNQERQKMEAKAVEDTLEGFPIPEKHEDFTVVIAGKDIHTGIKGLVAGKICERYNKPTVIFNESEDGTCWEGSGRSIEGFDIKEAFSECSDLLEKYGGHTKAGGLTLKKENLEKFKERFELCARKCLKKSDLVPCYHYDCEVMVTDLTNQFLRDIELFAPYGEANDEPMFVCHNAVVLEKYQMGAGKQHLKIKVSQNGVSMEVVAFGKGELYDKIPLSAKVDILGTAVENDFQGIRRVQIQAKDLHLVEEKESFSIREVLFDTLYFDTNCPVRVEEKLVLFYDEKKTKVDVFRKVDKNLEKVGELTPKIGAKVIKTIKKTTKIYFAVEVMSIEYIDNRYNVLIQISPISREK